MYYLYYMIQTKTHTEMKATTDVIVKWSNGRVEIVTLPTNEVYLAATQYTGYRLGGLNMALANVALNKRGYIYHSSVSFK